MEYNLTIGQKLMLPAIWVMWVLSCIGDTENVKTWHEVKKGMEKHEHKYVNNGTDYLVCEHIGCNMVYPVMCLECKYSVKNLDKLTIRDLQCTNKESPLYNSEVWSTDKCTKFEIKQD